MKNMPVPLNTSVTIVAVAILCGMFWGTEVVTFSARRFAVSFMLGGLSYWLWVVYRLVEQQSIRPYIGRPSIGSFENWETEVTQWFQNTRLIDSSEKGWMLNGARFYGFSLFIITLVINRWSFLAPWSYILATAFFMYYGLWRPKRFMESY